jgi:hypothetical protein
MLISRHLGKAMQYRNSSALPGGKRSKDQI